MGSDAGPDGSGDAGNELDASSDAIGSDGHAGDAAVEDAVGVDDAISAGDAIGAEASALPYIQCNETNTQQCTAQVEVCCGSWDWSGSSCTPSSGCSTVNARPLACDDKTDCPSGQICCAEVLTTSSLEVVNSSCVTACISPDTQLCRVTSECKSGSCVALPNGSTPTWLTHCQ